MEVVGYENRGRAVRRANDRDGSGVFEVEPEERGKAQREEDAPPVSLRPKAPHVSMGLSGCQALVRFFALRRIKPHLALCQGICNPNL